MRTLRRPKPLFVLGLGLTIVSTGSLLLGGCYRRVVSARGFGADQYQVSEPYQENSRMDDWVFGERPQKNNSRLKNLDK